jgi:hypothetical protein
MRDGLQLNRRNHDVPVRIIALRVCGDLRIISQSKVNQTTVVRIHGSKLDAGTMTLSTRSSVESHLLNLLLSTATITLNVDDDRIVELETAAQKGGDNRLKSLKRAPMATNENSKVTTAHIKDELTFVTIVLINGGVSLTEEIENTAEILNSDVGNTIGLVISQSDASLIVLANLSELVIRGALRSGIARDNLLRIDHLVEDSFLHHKPPKQVGI